MNAWEGFKHSLFAATLSHDKYNKGFKKSHMEKAEESTVTASVSDRTINAHQDGDLVSCNNLI